MASLLDSLFGASSSRVDRINRATEGALRGDAVTNPTLGQPGGEEAKAGEQTSMLKKRKKKRKLARSSSLSSAVRSVT